MVTTVEIVLRVVGTGVVVLGALTAYGTVRMWRKNAQTGNWPTVTGVIVSSELESQTNRHQRKPIRTYGAAIRYAYEVEGKSYDSDQVQLGGTSETTESADFERMVARYPEGTRVTVYYDPTDPATATIEPKKPG